MNLLPARATGRVFSFGGGVQSVAVLALQATGQLRNPYETFVFANVGADSENPDTLTYFEQHVKPFAARHGIQIVEVQKLRFGKPETLLEAIERDNRTVPIPARMSNGAPGNRTCTTDFKIIVVDRWIKKQGYNRCVVGLGISIDEWERAKDEQWHDRHGKRKIGYLKRREHPLIDQRLSRADCHRIIAGADLPIPPKSSCYFCPFHSRATWIELRREQPKLFERAIAIEQRINEKRHAMARDAVFLHMDARPLAQAVGAQPRLFEDDLCDGYCHT